MNMEYRLMSFLLILVPVVVWVAFVLWFGIRQVVMPLKALEKKAADLAWGNYEPIEKSVGGIGEIKHLQETLIQLASKMQYSEASLRGYIDAITTGQEEERQRLARELHDDTIQALIALNQRAQLASLQLEPCDAKNQLAEIQALTEQTIQDLRRLTQALRPQYLEDFGLVAALQVLSQDTRRAGDVFVEFTSTGAERRLPPDVELALYRIVQESLNNVVHHARAECARVELHFEPAVLQVRISDDGVGFEVPDNPAEFAPGGHFGLLGIYERTEMIDARLEIQSSPGEGTTLTITLDRAA